MKKIVVIDFAIDWLFEGETVMIIVFKVAIFLRDANCRQGGKGFGFIFRRCTLKLVVGGRLVRFRKCT